VEVTEEKNVAALKGLAHHHFNGRVLRIHLRARRDPLSIEILPRQRAPVVSDNDTIWVEDGDNLEDKIVP
jgi:hypothetical protein